MKKTPKKTPERKRKNDPPIQLDPETYQLIADRARRDDRSLKATVRLIVLEFLRTEQAA